MKDLYESISGRDDSERDWELCLSLFHPEARVSPNSLEDRVRAGSSSSGKRASG
jgi:hypothetical protein